MLGFEIFQEFDQRFDAFLGHGVVDRSAETAD